MGNLYSRVQHPTLTLAILSTILQEYPLNVYKPWDSGQVPHVLLPKLVH